MHEKHASIVALHRLKTFFKKSVDTFASTQYMVRNDDEVSIMYVAAFLDPTTYEVMSSDDRRLAEIFVKLEVILHISKLTKNVLKNRQNLNEKMPTIDILKIRRLLI